MRIFLWLCLLVMPASEVAAGHRSHLEALSPQLYELVEVAPSIPAGIQKLRGYALADELDELGRSRQMLEFIGRCAEAVSELSQAELAATLTDDDLRAALDSSLAERVDRLIELIDGVFGILASELDGAKVSELSAQLQESWFDMIGRMLDDRTRPVAERRLLRHSVRGMAALMCFTGRPGAHDLQAELLDHAIVGYESILRMASASCDDEGRARVVALGLEPVDRDELEQRAARLAAARSALDEARSVEPEFRLPPDPALLEKPRA